MKYTRIFFVSVLLALCLLGLGMTFTLTGCSANPAQTAAPEAAASDGNGASAQDAAQSVQGLYADQIPAREDRADSPAWVTELPAAQDEAVSQLFVVAGLGMDKTTATISMHERGSDGTWKQVLTTPGFVGKNGLIPDAERVEGCGRTPAGVYTFNMAFGIAPDPGCQMPYVQATEDMYWSGDHREGMHYNEMVDIKDYPDLNDGEHIVDYDYQYQYCLNISFNEEGTPGRGSAIFLHCFGPKNPYTAGCVAVPENIMKLIMQQVQPGCVVVIDTLEALSGSPEIT